MNIRFYRAFKVSSPLLTFVFVLFFAACEQPPQTTQNQPEPSVNTNVNSAAAPATANTNAAPPTSETSAANLPVTLPVLDAMFADESFAGELKSRLSLTDEQIEKLRTASREAVANLNEDEPEGGVGGSTNEATRRANEQIRGIIGEQKAGELARFVRERWEGGSENAAAAPGQQPNQIPADTRIVVNAPAYRMDFFRDGQLIKSYKIGIGYPEFPLPTGMRKAETLIFNPTWTPPDEPWVKGKIQPGKKVPAGSKLNPLGPIKIPIGLPSLIHGGKNPARLGGFASHGCVGLTDAQVQQVALDLAQLTGTELAPEDVKNFEKNKTETKNVKLSQTIPVELRYETIVVEDGKLRIFRDVYERGTNTEENLRRVLNAYGVSLDSLNPQERAKISDALSQMARDPQGNPADPATAPASANANVNGNANNNKNKDVKETKTIKGAKEMTIEIAALRGKGYPAPVNLNAGDNSKSNLNSANSNSNKNAAGGSSRRF